MSQASHWSKKIVVTPAAEPAIRDIMCRKDRCLALADKHAFVPVFRRCRRPTAT